MYMKNLRNKLAAVAATGAVVLASAPAFAQSSFDAAVVTSELDKTLIVAVGVAILGISGVIAMIRAGKRSANA